MSITAIGAGITRKVIVHAPEICVIGGTVGMVVGGVMGVRATLKITEVTEPTVKDYVKAYGPPVLIAGASTYAIFNGTNIFRKRSIALISTCALLEKQLDNIESRIKDEDLVYKMRNAIETRKVKFMETDKNGKEKEIEKEVEVAPDPRHDEAAKFFCESCMCWSEDPEQNMIFLKEQEKVATELLKKRGWLKLNTVYEMLDIPQTEFGENVGWVLGYGDDFVDFGIYSLYREGNRRFVNGLEPVILLDFNHDGYLWNKIGVG